MTELYQRVSSVPEPDVTLCTTHMDSSSDTRARLMSAAEDVPVEHIEDTNALPLDKSDSDLSDHYGSPDTPASTDDSSVSDVDLGTSDAMCVDNGQKEESCAVSETTASSLSLNAPPMEAPVAARGLTHFPNDGFGTSGQSPYPKPGNAIKYLGPSLMFNNLFGAF